MPLLRRQPFIKEKPPADLTNDEEVFYCKLTKEIFRDYEEFFDRVILCNSLVWSCSISGKPNLTYQEALQNEERCRKHVSNLPTELKRGLLYVSSLTKRARQGDMFDDVFAFLRDRYLKGEEIEALIQKQWTDCKILKVRGPTEKELKDYSKKNGMGSKDSCIPSELYTYEVEPIKDDDESDSDCDVLTIHEVKGDEIRRDKRMFTREKTKLFLKIHCDLSPLGYWVVKESDMKRYKLREISIGDIFVDPKPKFEETPGSPKRQSAHPKSRDSHVSNIDKIIDGVAFSESESKDGKRAKKKSKAEMEEEMLRKQEETRERIKEDLRIKAEKMKYEKMKEREKQKEEKRLVGNFMKNWNKPKEDLECEDLKELPAPTPIRCRVPNDCFGDFLMVLEYFHCFSDLMNVRDAFNQGLTFDILERAIVEKEVAGYLADILQMLLTTLFRLQEQESEESSEESQEEAAADLDVFELNEDVSVYAAMKSATLASGWSQLYQGQPLRKLTLDSLTLTEILRLHLMASGARCSENSSKWRYQQRGGYENQDDPGLSFRLEEPSILRKLGLMNVCQLSPGEKLKIIACLVHQILSYVEFRDAVEDHGEKYRQARYELKLHVQAEHRKEKEENIQRVKKLLDEREKLIASGKDPKTLPKITPAETRNHDGDYVDEVHGRDLRNKKNDGHKKEMGLNQQIVDHLQHVYTLPLGRDRAFRRYWMFHAVQGLFVENDYDDVGECLPNGTPLNPSLNVEQYALDCVQSAMRQKDELSRNLLESNGGSDKENDSGLELKVENGPQRTYTSKKKDCSVVLTDLAEKLENGPLRDDRTLEEHLSIKVEQVLQKAVNDASVKMEVEANVSQKYNVCTGDESTCLVHSTYIPRTKWSFYGKEHDLDKLLEGLSVRGMREAELRQALLQEKSRLVQSIQHCPLDKLDCSHLPSDIPGDKNKRSAAPKNDFNFSYPAGTPIDKIMELMLRDMMLEIEEKIHLGNLGSLKVKNRDRWRNAIEQGTFDKQCEKLFLHDGKRLSSELDDLDNDPVSRSSTPDSVLSDEAEKANERKRVQKTVRELSIALLQLSQSVERKFLQKPLGIYEKEKKSSRKSKTKEDLKKSQDDADLKKSPLTLEKWETSLMASTSFSQLFVHLNTLDSSVMWNRSILKVRCKVCKKQGEAEVLLLCDECNAGFHMYCLKPPLAHIPRGDWFCMTCKPKEIPKTPKKKRKIFSEDDMESDTPASESSEEEEEESDDEEREEESEEEEEKESEEESDDQSEEDVTVDNDDECGECNEGGDIIPCSSCTASYHIECLDPPLKRKPRGDWNCPRCTNKSNSKGKNKEESSGARRSLSKSFFSGLNKKSSGSKSTSTPQDPPHLVPQNKRLSLASDSRSGSKRSSARDAAERITKVSRTLNRKNSIDDSDSDSLKSLPRLKAQGNDSKNRSRDRRSWRKTSESDLILDTVKLSELINNLNKHPEAWPFLKPVSKSEAPRYNEVVSHPMDFAKIKNKLNEMVYKSNDQMFADIVLVFENCHAYNEEDSDEYKASVKLNNHFEKLCDQMDLHYIRDRLVMSSSEPPEKRARRRL